MVSQIELLVEKLEGFAQAGDWSAMAAEEPVIRHLVSEACADPHADVATLNQLVGTLQALFQRAIAEVERQRSDSASDMVQTRRQFKAAQSYLDQSRHKR